MAEADNDDLISLFEDEEKDFDLPSVLPLMAVRDVVVFPDMLIPLFIGRNKSIRAVEEAVAKDGFILLATQKKHHLEEPQPDDIYETGTISRVLRMLKLPDGRVKALIQGIAKVKIIKFIRKRSFYRVKSELILEKPIKKITIPIEALMRSVREYSEKIIELKGEFTGDISAILESIDSPGKLADLVTSNLKLKISESQQLLEIIDPVKRLKKINKLLSREVELSSMQAKIQSNVKVELSKNQRDYFLREQVRAINKELGDDNDKSQEIDEYKNKIKHAKMPIEAEKQAEKELKRFSLMHTDSAEASVIRTYLDWLVEMPWSNSTKDNLNIKKAKTELHKEHYGLDKIKDRILEYLSVKKLNPDTKGQILCLVGPPGVGKTSLGQAVAKAMGRKFIRLSLGGIHDEAEIRGHRRTYIGALPGRILQGLKQCSVNNPVFMLDEIDKIGADFRGDPSAALLEALDPEQNSEFSDHYLNLSFDLSKVMFILTANITDTIPSALLDRMEVINLAGYTEEEKRIIAEKFLIPRQIEETGLKSKTCSISRRALLRIIREYTMEAGLRNLEREISKICRKIARKIADGGKKEFQITKNNLEQYLGVPKFYPEMDKEESQVGLATGLAWTEVGGEVLYVESSLISGKGDLIVTGQIGDVMQESARAALSYTRANSQALGIKKDFFENLDVHIHVPAGAIPKDGPSAGIVMATALISSATGKLVDKDVAMTGEITLRGRVLPIGGLKEKALGALRAGINTIIIPEKNSKDIIELPANVKKKIKFITITNMSEVIPLALKNSKNNK